MFQAEEEKNSTLGLGKFALSPSKKFKTNSQNVIQFAGIATLHADGHEEILKTCQRCLLPFVASGTQRNRRIFCSSRCAAKAGHILWIHSNKSRRAQHYRKSYTLKAYKLTPEGFEELIKKQNNQCGICHREFSGKLKPCIDHNHACCPKRPTCGKCIRGLLCLGCNGWMEKLSNPQYKNAVDEYLRLHG